MCSPKALICFQLSGALLCLLLANNPAAAQIVPLGLDNIGGSVECPCISADGSKVVSAVVDGFGHPEAAFWSNGTIQTLGFLDPSNPLSLATAASFDGQVIVGMSTNASGFTEAVRWNNGAIAGLGFLTNNSSYSIATGVSSDGSIVVGASGTGSGDVEAFRWSGGNMIGLGSLGPNAGQLMSWASGISADGSVIVGRSLNPSMNYEAFRWSGGSMQGLGFLDSANTASSALAVSGNGKVIVGWSRDALGLDEAFRWKDGAMVGLGFLEPSVSNRFSQANAVSFDGNVVVGIGTTLSGTDGAFRWTPTTGLQNLTTVAQIAGINMLGISLLNATGVSAGGDVIVGSGLTSSGDGASWLLKLNPAGPSGLITPGAAISSLAGLSAIPGGISSWLDSGLEIHSEVALEHRCERNGRLLSAVCAFAYIDGGTFSGDEGSNINGTAGLNIDLGSGWTAGTSTRDGHSDTALDSDGSAKFNLWSGTLFVASVPDTGPQIVIAATAAGFDGDIDRGYMNGVGTSTSIGKTAGTGFAGSARLGWAFETFPGIFIAPFTNYSATRVEMNGWKEDGGPFPATIADINETDQKLRVGADARLRVSRTSWVWGSLAWSHRFGAKQAGITGDVAGLISVSTNGGPIEQDWLEVTIGFRMPISQASSVSASMTTEAFSDNVPLFDGRLGYSHQF